PTAVLVFRAVRIHAGRGSAGAQKIEIKRKSGVRVRFINPVHYHFVIAMWRPNRQCASASRSRCLPHRKRGSQQEFRADRNIRAKAAYEEHWGRDISWQEIELH